MRRSSEEKRAFWRMVVQMQEESGLSVRKFCEQEGLGQASFFGWRRKFRAEEAEAGDGSDGGGRTGTILYSLVCSAKANRVHPYFYLEDVYRRLPQIRQHESLLPPLRDACGQVELADGTRPRLELIDSPLDHLRILKDHPRPLIERMREDSQIDPTLVAKLNDLLPDRWLAQHPDAHLEISRRTRIVGEAA